MTLRCKPGDLAVIVHADFPQMAMDIGKIVRVVAPALGYADLRFFWECVSQSSPLIHMWCEEGPDGRFVECPGQFGFDMCTDIPDASLRPIRPDAEPESVERIAELTA